MKPQKVSEVLKMLKEDGWYLVSQEGSHQHYKHPRKLGKVTVAGKASETLPPKTLARILKQAGLK